MAKDAKPDIIGLGKEGKITFNGTSYHNGSNDDTLDSLIDGDINKHTVYGALVTGNEDSHFKFTIEQDSNIYAYGQYYSDSGGSVGSYEIDLYREDKNHEFKFYKRYTTKVSEWYLLFDNLPAGTYQIKNTLDHYVQFTEWYVEDIKIKHRFLLRQNGLYYSIKKEFLDEDSNTYKPCENDFDNNGFFLEELFTSNELNPLSLFKGKIDIIQFQKNYD